MTILNTRTVLVPWPLNGSHTYDACQSDFLSVKHYIGIIVADDLRVTSWREETQPDSVIVLSHDKNRYDMALHSAYRRAAYLTDQKPA